MIDPTLARDAAAAIALTAVVVVAALAAAVRMASRFEDEWDDVHRDRRDEP